MKYALRVFAAAALSTAASAAVIVNYSEDLGGVVGGPLNGLAAQASFDVSGNIFTVRLRNISTGVPLAATTADSLLVSVAFTLPGVSIVSGDSALIGPTSTGVGAWSARGPGASVAEEWLWTNAFGGDLLEAYPQVISTSSGTGGGADFGFAGHPGDVDGPFGGIVAAPPVLGLAPSQEGVSNEIVFTLTLSGTLSPAQLNDVASTSVVEFGSNARYLGVPEPAALTLLALGLALLRRR